MKANSENEKNSSKNKLIQRLIPWKRSSEINESFKGLLQERTKIYKFSNDKADVPTYTEKTE